MHKKYFFFDVDGTLASGLTTIMPESAKRCVARLRENGHFTALATGRLQASAAVVAERYGFTHFVADGGYSLTLDGKVIEMEGLPVADCISFIDRLEAAGIPWAVTSGVMQRRSLSGCCAGQLLPGPGGPVVRLSQDGPAVQGQFCLRAGGREQDRLRRPADRAI